MTSPIPATAKLDLTLTLTLTGAVEPISNEFGIGTFADDLAIDALYYHKERFTFGKWVITASHNILSDVDTSNPHVQRLLSNLLAACETEAAEALCDEVTE